MTYDPRIHHRRSIRLRGHDYGGGGAYFVTCCVEGKDNRLLSRTGRRLLQEDYFEHVIRNADSLEKIRDYILTNPARWRDDPENPGRRPRNELASEWDWLGDL